MARAAAALFAKATENLIAASPDQSQIRLSRYDDIITNWRARMRVSTGGQI
jgi:hypothetical protein